MAAIAITPSSIHLPASQPAATPSVIKQVALSALAELTASLAILALCLPFVATSAGTSLMVGATFATVGANFLIQLVAKKFFQSKDVSGLEVCLRSASFSAFTASHAITLVHEAGHACSAKLLFQGEPSISLIPFGGGFTRYSTSALTEWGKKLGHRHSVLLIVVAGPALALLAGTVLLVAGLALGKSHPQLSEYMTSTSWQNFISHAQYAFSALNASPADLSNDFVRLKAYGLHPIAAATAILAIPLLTYLAFSCLRPKASCETAPQ